MILAISFIGEMLKYFLPLPIPASIYGMMILFIGLLTGIIPLEAVKDVGKFLIEIMPVMFIPAGVGLMASWGVLKPMIIPVSGGNRSYRYGGVGQNFPDDYPHGPEEEREECGQ